jgi:hypothetical protein
MDKSTNGLKIRSVKRGNDWQPKEPSQFRKKAIQTRAVGT